MLITGLRCSPATPPSPPRNERAKFGHLDFCGFSPDDLVIVHVRRVRVRVCKTTFYKALLYKSALTASL